MLWGEQRASGVDAILLKPTGDLGPIPLGGAVMIPQQHQSGVGGQVIEYGAAALKKKRQVILCAAGHAASADFSEGRAQIGVAIELLEPRHLEAMRGIATDRELPGGHQLDLLDAINGALSFRVKGPQGFDLVIQQVDSVGCVAAHWEYI